MTFRLPSVTLLTYFSDPSVTHYRHISMTHFSDIFLTYFSDTSVTHYSHISVTQFSRTFIALGKRLHHTSNSVVISIVIRIKHLHKSNWLCSLLDEANDFRFVIHIHFFDYHS